MNRICIPLTVLAGLLALSPVSVVGAESASSNLLQSLKDCVEVSDDTDRLACFDREMGKSGQTEVVPVEQETVDTASEEEKFGIVEKKDRNEELTEIKATVVKVANRSNRTFTILLDNDQIWRQKYVGSFHIKAGDVVTIIKGNFGGFTLELNGRREAVDRVK